MGTSEMFVPINMGFTQKKGARQMKTFFECIIGIGLFIIIGSAGSTDINAISLTQAILIVILGLVIMFIGIVGCNGAKKGR